jgi:glycosyltransferase involved in cell wall biosynthesis
MSVSIILPTYNRSELLSQAIDSVLEQTFEDFLLVVVDDGSTDDTRSVVMGHDDDRIRYISHDRNRGPSAARNTALENVETDFVTFLDSDDRLKRTFLETSLRTLRDEPNDCAGTCVSYETLVNHDRGKVEREIIPVPKMIDRDNGIDDVTPRFGGLLLRATAIETVGYFDEHQPYNEDVDYWIRLFEHGYHLRGIQKPLYQYYVHGNQQTRNTETRIAGLAAFLQKHDEALPAAYRAKLYRDLGMAYVQKDEFANASRQFRCAIKDSSGASMNYWYYLTARTCPRLLPVGKRAKRIVVEMLRRSRLS